MLSGIGCHTLSLSHHFSPLSTTYALYSKPNVDTYNALLDDYEKGITENQLDTIFKELKEGTIPLIEAISKKDKVNQIPENDIKRIAQEFKVNLGFADIENEEINSNVIPINTKLAINYKEELKKL